MLEIYQKEGCPFCQKVRARLSELGLSWVAHSAEPGQRSTEVLKKISGEQKVPFLVDTDRNVMMPESDDIIYYIDEHYAPEP